MTRVLGLDISTSTIGISVIEQDENSSGPILKFHHYYKPPEKELPEFQYLKCTKDYILKIVDEFKPDLVAIEDYSKFMKGKSSATTILKLATLNRTIGFAVYELTGKEPVLLNVLKIRHTLKLDKELPAKEEMPGLVAKHLKLTEYPYYYETDKKGNIKIKIESYDVADSISVALCCMVCYLKGESLTQMAPKEKTKLKKKKKRKTRKKIKK